MAGKDRSDCIDCRKAYRPSRWDSEAEKNKKRNGPPCGTCRPLIMAENIQAFGIYEIASDQYIIGTLSGPVAIMDSSIESDMRIHGVPINDRPECHLKVKTIAKIIFNERAAKKEKESA